MPTEVNLWSWLKKGSKKLKHLHMSRQENLLHAGPSDVEGCYAGMGFWIELKVCDRPKRLETLVRIKWQPAQIPWLRRRWNAGGMACALIQVGEGKDALRYLIPANELYVGRSNAYFEEELKDLSLVWPDCTAEDVIKELHSFWAMGATFP